MRAEGMRWGTEVEEAQAEARAFLAEAQGARAADAAGGGPPPRLVVLDRTGGDQLGIGVDQRDKVALRLQDIKQDGLFPRWNRAHPEEAVLVNDRIVEVNGRRGNVDVLLAELARKELLRIRIDRPLAEGLEDQVEPALIPALPLPGAAKPKAASKSMAPKEQPGNWDNKHNRIILRLFRLLVTEKLCSLSHEAILELFERADDDNSGTLSLEQFHHFMARGQGFRKSFDMRQAFTILDDQRNGHIAHVEFSGVLKRKIGIDEESSNHIYYLIDSWSFSGTAVRQGKTDGVVRVDEFDGAINDPRVIAGLNTPRAIRRPPNTPPAPAQVLKAGTPPIPKQPRLV